MVDPLQRRDAVRRIARHEAQWRDAIDRPSGVIGATLLLIVLAVAAVAPLLVTTDPFALAGAPLAAPTASHLLGTDALGRDLLSGVVRGARASLLVAACAALLACLVGTSIGVISGYRGGLADDVLMRLTEIVQTLPRFFLVVVVLALLGPGITRIIVVLGLTSWPTLARVVRAETAAIRDFEFVVAARAAGAAESRVMWRHLLPSLLPDLAVVSGLLFGQALLIEASIGFIGLGDPDTLSWGTLAGQARPFFRVAWWLSVFPGLAIACAVLGVNLLADAVASGSHERGR